MGSKMTQNWQNCYIFQTKWSRILIFVHIPTFSNQSNSFIVFSASMFFARNRFTYISWLIHLIKTLAASNHTIQNPADTNCHTSNCHTHNSGSISKHVGTSVGTLCCENTFKTEFSSFACLWLCAVYVVWKCKKTNFSISRNALAQIWPTLYLSSP